jgi:hypothetical protein
MFEIKFIWLKIMDVSEPLKFNVFSSSQPMSHLRLALYHLAQKRSFPLFSTSSKNTSHLSNGVLYSFEIEPITAGFVSIFEGITNPSNQTSSVTVLFARRSGNKVYFREFWRISTSKKSKSSPSQTEQHFTISWIATFWPFQQSHRPNGHINNRKRPIE